MSTSLRLSPRTGTTFGTQHLSLNGVRQQNGPTRHRKTVANLRDGCLQDLAVGFVESFAELQGLALHNRAVLDAHEVHKCRLRVPHDGVDLHVRNGGIHHRAFRLELLQRLELELVLLGFLEPQVRRRVRHALFQGFLDVGEVPFQHLSNRVDAFVVTRLELLAHARPQAISDVEFQAHPKLPLRNVLFGREDVRMGCSLP